MNEILNELIEGRNIWGTYFLIGIIIAIINGAVRKIEADPLLGLAWILIWPMTPLGALVRLIIYVVMAVRAYQPYRRTKIYFLRKF